MLKVVAISPDELLALIYCIDTSRIISDFLADFEPDLVISDFPPECEPKLLTVQDEINAILS